MSFNDEPLWRVCWQFLVRMVYLLFVEPFEELKYYLGLTDDGLDAARHRNQSLPRRAMSLAGALAMAVLRLPLVLWHAGGVIFWDVIYFLGLAKDQADATRALRMGLGRRAAPAVLAIVLVSTGAMWVTAVDKETLVDQYLEAVKTLDDNDLDRAAICYERLAQLEPSELDYPYELALVEQRRGHVDRAVELMEEIAPLKSAGYGPAHLWLAEEVLGKGTVSLDEAATAWAHLKHVLEREPDNLAVNDRLSRVMVNLGLLAEAEPYLVRAAEMRPELHVLLARIYAEQHRAADARREAALARDHLASQVEQSPDNSIRRLQLANALLYLDDYEAARDVLHDSPDHDQNELILRRLREIYVSWADADLRKSRSHEDYLDRLSMALRDDPTNLAAVARVVAVRRQFPELRGRTDDILDSLHFDHLPPPVHLMLATTAIERGLPIVARRHLEEGLRLQPDYPEAANNLAWLLAHAEPKDLPRALDLVNAALVKFPRHPMLLETRGRVLLLSERWKEARIDLETVAFVKQSDASLHEALGTCYEKLGMTDQAERERKLAGGSKTPLPSGEGGER